MLLKSTVTALVALTALAGIAAPSAAAPDAAVVMGEPHPAAHAHNDYEHDRPLLDALEHGFTSVEADVWLVDGELRVAHDREDAVPASPSKASTWTRWISSCGSRATAFTRAGTAACNCLSTSRATAKRPTRPSRRNSPSTRR